jgi:hypothetical protein
MRRKAFLLAFALAGTAAPASADSPPLAGRYDALAEAAGACLKATGRNGVDRASLAASGWGETSSGEIDHNPVSWAYSKRNPFVLRINSYQLTDPEHCWMVTRFKRQKDFAEVRLRLERLLGRAPDSADDDDMRETSWVNAENTIELWMMPASKLCSECPSMFVTIRPRTAE